MLPPTGPVVGVIPDACFAVKEITLGENSVFLAFTDGIPDALNPEGIPFGNDRLLKLLNESDTTSASLLKNIEGQLHQYISAANQFDDITLLAIQKYSSNFR